MVKQTTDVLTANQIRGNLSNHPATCKYFEGVFALDELPTYYLTRRPCLVVCNTAFSKSSGEHWVGFFLSENQVEFFDSYGMPPSNKSFANFIATNGGDGMHFNPYSLQGLTSTTCGKYVTTYLLCRSLGISSEMYVNEVGGGDDNVRELYEKSFGCNYHKCVGQTCRPRGI